MLLLNDVKKVVNSIEKTSFKIKNDFYIFGFSIAGFNLAIDVEQVVELTFAPTLPKAFNRDEKFIKTSDNSIVFSPAYVLNENFDNLLKPRMIKFYKDEKKMGLIIEEPEVFKKINISDISPMPSIVNKLRGNSILWGIIQQENGFIYLIDCYRL